MSLKIFRTVFFFITLMSTCLLAEEGPSFDPEKNPYEVPEYKPDDRFYTEILNMASTLGLLIVTLIIITWFFKKMMSARIQQMNITSDIKILESRALSTKLNVHLIQVHEKEILFAESTTGVEKLAEFPSERKTFEEIMKDKND